MYDNFDNGFYTLSVFKNLKAKFSLDVGSWKTAKLNKLKIKKKNVTWFYFEIAGRMF